MSTNEIDPTDKDYFKGLEVEYEKAREEKASSFVYRDRTFVTGYAKYLIQYHKSLI